MQIANLAFQNASTLIAFLIKRYHQCRLIGSRNSSLTACRHKHICTHEMDAKYASGMNVSYLKSFEKKYSLDFEVSGCSHGLPLYFESILMMFGENVFVTRPTEPSYRNENFP